MSVAPISSPLPPPGTYWLAEIGPAINFLMISSTMGSVMVVMLLALIIFSSRGLRATPIFLLNVTIVLLAIADAVMVVYNQVHSLKSPDIPLHPAIVLIVGCIDGFTPILADSVLLLRIFAIFPYRTTSRSTFLAVVGIPVIIKVVRFINSLIYIAVNSQNGPKGAAVLVLSHLPSVKIEWFLQMFDNAISSGIFLLRMRRFISLQISHSFAEKIYSLLWIATCNFVFPVMLGIVQLIIYISTKHYLLAVYIEQVNFHINIAGVVFATVWVAESRWSHADDGPSEIGLGFTIPERRQSLVDIQFATTVSPEQSVHYSSRSQAFPVPRHG
ncbi:hypothetical protein C8J56DRAFT_819774 [Mycena floridula]|nr:hypothetical protein C8J56DRAFT_819774 [Mycena floridula]